MNRLQRKALWLLFCLSFLNVYGLVASRADEAKGISTPELFMEQFSSYYNQGDFKTIYKNMGTARFKSSTGFPQFQEAMEKLKEKEGAIKGYRQEYGFDDQRFEGMKFYRLQYKVEHEKAVTTQRFVLMVQEGSLFLDGYAVYSQGAFDIAQGNLYDFDALDIALGKENNPDAKDWVRIREKEVLKDSADLKEFSKRDDKDQKDAIVLASQGKFGDAEKLFRKRKQQEMDMNLDVIDAINRGEISKEVGALIFQADKAYEIDEDLAKGISLLQEAYALEPNSVITSAVLSGFYIEQKDFEKALEFAKHVIAIDPQNKYGHGLIALCYLNLGELEKGKEHGKKAVDMVSDLIPMAIPMIQAGVERKYFFNGKVEFESVFINGRPSGPYKGYYSTGELKEEGTFKDGELDGAGKMYYQDGAVKAEFEYKNGQMIYIRELDRQGNIIKNEEYHK